MREGLRRVLRGHAPMPMSDHTDAPDIAERLRGAADHSRMYGTYGGLAIFTEAAAEIERLRKAGEAALHALVTLQGLTASDGLGIYGDALGEGCDANGAWDLFVAQTWKIDSAATIAQLTTALGLPAPTSPKPTCDECGGEGFIVAEDTHLCPDCKGSGYADARSEDRRG